MSLVDRILIPIDEMPLDKWERDLCGDLKIFELFTLDLSMNSTTFTHDRFGRLFSMDIWSPMDYKKISVIRAFDDCYHQIHNFRPEMKEEVLGLFGNFELHYSPIHHTLMSIKRIP